MAQKQQVGEILTRLTTVFARIFVTFAFATSRLIACEAHFIGSLKSWRVTELFEKEVSLAELSAINLAGCGFSHASFLKENHALLDQYLRYPMRYASRGSAQDTRTYFYLLRIRGSPRF